MKKNVKKIIITVPSEAHLKRINTTPALKNLFRSELAVGDNLLRVNHFNYSEISRMQCGLYTVKNN